MKESRLLIIILFLIAICIAIPSSLKKSEAGTIYNGRTFFVEERIVLKDIPRDANNLPRPFKWRSLRIWIPYPVGDRWQKVSNFKLEGPFEHSVIADKTYGNRIIYLQEGQNVLHGNTVEIILSFRVERKEYGLPFDSSTVLTINPQEDISQFLKPNRLVPVNGEIKALAAQITQGKKTDLEKARAIYDYIIDKLTYSKDDPRVCGVGDSLLTLQYLKGICTDYHSLFISLARSLGIPAKFEIGFPVPEGVKEHTRNGYHCWAKFYLKGKGWIPVDISEADKHPEKRDYFFGHIDKNRVHFTTGRDIRLMYAKNPDSLNFFIYPYAELNGSQFFNMDFEITFRELEGGDGKI